MIAPVRGIVEAVRTALVDVARRPLFSVLSIAAMAVAAFVLFGFLLVSRGAREFFGTLAAQSVIEVYLHPGATPDAVAQVRTELERSPAVAQVDAVTPAQALAEFSRLYPDLRDVPALLGENPLPSSFRVRQREGATAAVLALLNRLRADAAVLSVRYDREWVAALARAGESLGVAVLGGAVLLTLAGLVTVGSVVRLALDDKLDEVRLLRLVGAPVSVVLAPVLMSGAILASGGTGLAVAAITAGRGALLTAAADTPLGALARASLGPGVPAAWSVLVILCAALAGAVAAGLAAGRTTLG